jgi:hypothetical protein
MSYIYGSECVEDFVINKVYRIAILTAKSTSVSCAQYLQVNESSRVLAATKTYTTPHTRLLAVLHSHSSELSAESFVKLFE